ncbi:MAG: helix-turn-helix domain-containing protein [Pseudomonadota bacterium]
MPTIRLVHYHNALTSSISFPMDIFTSATAAHTVMSRTRHHTRLEVIHADTPLANESMVSHSLLNSTHLSKQHDNACDLIILSAIWRNPLLLIQHAGTLIQWLISQHEQGAQICAVGSASFLLAEAGLLTHQAATTHWFYFDLFETRYPDVKLQRDHLITKSGRLYCAGSINAIADLSVYFCERFYGKQIAQQMASQFSPEIRRSIDSQIYTERSLHNLPDERITLLKHWLYERHSQHITLQEMADYLGIGQRHLSRLCKQHTGLTPVALHHSLRIKQACELLKKSNLRIIDIAQQCGYGSSSHFIKHFKKRMGKTPKQHRIQLRKKLFK